MEPKQWAYLAGAIDMDGSIFIGSSVSHGKKYKREVVNLTNSNRKAVEWAKENTGMGFIATQPSTYKNLKKAPKNPKNTYRWVVTSRQARIVLRNILPYLVIKKDAAIKVLNFRKNVVSSAVTQLLF